MPLSVAEARPSCQTAPHLQFPSLQLRRTEWVACHLIVLNVLVCCLCGRAPIHLCDRALVPALPLRLLAKRLRAPRTSHRTGIRSGYICERGQFSESLPFWRVSIRQDEHSTHFMITPSKPTACCGIECALKGETTVIHLGCTAMIHQEGLRGTHRADANDRPECARSGCD